MIITGRRIRSLGSRLDHLQDGEQLIMCLSNPENYSGILREVGFSEDFEIGERVLPADSFGPRSRFNAHGEYEVHRDQPMETVYRTIEWHWEEFHGPYDTVEQSRYVDVPYQRYPRTFIPPPSVEFTVRSTTEGQKTLSTDSIRYIEDNYDEILHRINLFLEIFGMCDVRHENLDDIISCQVRNLNWRILPEGRRPWSELRNDVESIINSAPRGNRPFIYHRVETINTYEPNFVGVGHGGFHGYLIFGFSDMDIYVLESIHYGNATYVLGDDWETVSQLTKAEVLNENRHLYRMIHSSDWADNISEILNN